MEIWDAYDREGVLLPIKLIRDETIPAGVYHLCSEIVVRHTDGTYLLMRRDLRKKTWPGYYEIGAGGSVLAGETAREGAFRELREETGIVVDEMEEIYRCVSDREATIFCGYLAVTDCPKDSVVLQEGETIAYKWLGREEFLEFYASDDCIAGRKIRIADFIRTL